MVKASCYTKLTILNMYGYVWLLVVTRIVVQTSFRIVEALEVAKTKGESLGSTSYTHESGHGSILNILLDAEVSKGIFACRDLLANT